MNNMKNVLSCLYSILVLVSFDAFAMNDVFGLEQNSVQSSIDPRVAEMRAQAARRYQDYCQEQQSRAQVVAEERIMSIGDETLAENFQAVHSQLSLEPRAIEGEEQSELQESDDEWQQLTRLIDPLGLHDEQQGRLLNQALERGDEGAVRTLLEGELQNLASHVETVGSTPFVSPVSSRNLQQNQVHATSGNLIRQQQIASVNFSTGQTGSTQKTWLNYAEMVTAIGRGLAYMAQVNTKGHKQLFALITDIMRLTNGALAVVNRSSSWSSFVGEGGFNHALWGVHDLFSFYGHLVKQDGAFNENVADNMIEKIARFVVLPAAEGVLAFYIALDDRRDSVSLRRCFVSLGSVVRSLQRALSLPRDSAESRLSLAVATATAIFVVIDFVQSR